MAIETWSPPAQRSSWGGFDFPGRYAKPPGEGWSITGYNQRSVKIPNPKMGSGFQTRTLNIPIYSRMTAPAPAPAPPPPPPPAPPAPPQLSPEAIAYRKEADAKLAEAQGILDTFKIEQNRAEEARKLQEKLAIQSQAAATANLARQQMAPNLQIQPASGTPQTAGTQGFRRRQQQFMPSIRTMSGINVPTSNVLNI